MIRVLIADDHPIVRRGLIQVLEDAPDIVIAGEAESGEEFMRKLEGGDVDVGLMDISMPGQGGLETLGEVKRLYPDLPVLVLSIHPEELYAIRALKAGAAGYLNKSSAPDQLITALRKVHAGGKFVTPSLAEIMAGELDADTDKPLHEMLSNREYQVMCKLAEGKSVSDIAEDLFLSVKTVSTYRSRIMSKMKMRNNAELAHYAAKMNLV